MVIFQSPLPNSIFCLPCCPVGVACGGAPCWQDMHPAPLPSSFVSLHFTRARYHVAADGGGFTSVSMCVPLIDFSCLLERAGISDDVQ